MSFIEQTVAEIPDELPTAIAEAIIQRWNSLTKPRGSLGILETSVVRLAQIQGTSTPDISRPCVYVFCGEHGITEENVSLYPSAVTREMAKNFVHGGAAVNVLSRQYGLATYVVDAGLSGDKMDGLLDQRIADGTRNFLSEPAMTIEQASLAIERGIRLGQQAAQTHNIAAVGEMGIGNTTSASALVAVLTGSSVEQVTGRGTGLNDAGLDRKRKVLQSALNKFGHTIPDGLSLVATFGGFEIAMMAGFLLGSAARGLPVVLDGFISGAAFLVARAFCPQIADRVLFGHSSAERGHAAVLKIARSSPLLRLGMCLGEGTGAVLAIGLLASAMKLYREMATFTEAGISDIAEPR